jgi:hypothetical protein
MKTFNRHFVALKGRKATEAFRYFNKGSMAVVGKNYAVLEHGRLQTSGFLTWLVWAFIHVVSLPQQQNRLRVQRQWLWSYFTGQRGSRLIPEPPWAVSSAHGGGSEPTRIGKTMSSKSKCPFASVGSPIIAGLEVSMGWVGTIRMI